MDFKEKYNTYTNTELLRIIENPDSYQPKAVEAAKSIFSERQLTAEEIKIAQDELEIERQEKLNKQQKKRAVETKFKNIGKSILENVNPIQPAPPTTAKTITIISVLFGALFLYQLYKDIGMISFIFTDRSMEWDFSMVIYLLSFVFIPTAIILFYKRQKMGWLLMTIYLTSSAVAAIGLIILTMQMEPFGIPEFDSMFPHTSPAPHLMKLVLFAGTIWAICRENMRTVYSINKLTMVLIISITAIIAGLVINSIYYP